MTKVFDIMVAFYRVNSRIDHIHCLQHDPQGTISNPQNKHKKQILSTWIDHHAIGSAYQEVIDQHHKSESHPRLLIPQFPISYPAHVVLALALTLLQIQSLLRLGGWFYSRHNFTRTYLHA